MFKKYKGFFLFFLLSTILFTACKNENKTQDNKEELSEQRIVSLNGAVTEIIVDLGHQSELVGRDMTSNYPDWVKDSVKNLGHTRSLTMESLMELKPTLILGTEDELSDELKEKIKNSGLKYKLFRQEYSLEGTKTLIKKVSEFIGSENAGDLIKNIDKDVAKVTQFKNKPKVMFIYARGAGTMMVAGKNTPMHQIIDLAGGKNVVTEFEDFKPLTTEAVVEGNPDVLLLFNSGLESLGGDSDLLKIPGIIETQAGKNKAIITMDGGLLSNFGPRVGKAAVKLNQLLSDYAK